MPHESLDYRVVIGSTLITSVRTSTDAGYRALLQAAGRVDARFTLALVLAHETGHRLGAIRHFRWSDVDLDAGVARRSRLAAMMPVTHLVRFDRRLL